MKKIYFLFTILFWAAVLPYQVHAAEVSEVAKDHETLAASYEQRAAAQDAIIQEHLKMKAADKKRFYVNEKVTPMSRLSKMDVHCGKIIKAAQKEKEALLDFAKWHRMRAAELEGK